MQILIIDDDDDLLKLLEQALKAEYQVITHRSVLQVTQKDLASCDFVILDVMMPEQNGFEFLREHRQEIAVPVLFLTAKDFEADKLEGFASGGDDYLTKPFSIRELRARIAAHLRREKRRQVPPLTSGLITCDLLARKFFCQNVPVDLTSSEFDLCVFLMKQTNQIFSKETIYTQVYGFEARGDSATTITERVKKIRHKFQEHGVNPIKTVWGIGYQWNESPSKIS